MLRMTNRWDLWGVGRGSGLYKVYKRCRGAGLCRINESRNKAMTVLSPHVPCGLGWSFWSHTHLELDHLSHAGTVLSANWTTAPKKERTEMDRRSEGIGLGIKNYGPEVRWHKSFRCWVVCMDPPSIDRTSNGWGASAVEPLMAHCPIPGQDLQFGMPHDQCRSISSVGSRVFPGDGGSRLGAKSLPGELSARRH